MAKVERFEDLQCWQKARQLANCIYDLTIQLSFNRDFTLAGQIRAAASSVMHNIAEGFEASTNPEFIRFLIIARRSGSEVQSELYLALDRLYIIQEEFDTAYNLATESKRIINGFISYLRAHKKHLSVTT